MDSQPQKGKNAPAAGRRRAGRDPSLGACAVLGIALFLFRIAPWLTSDLWYDEVVTLAEFAAGPPDRNGLLSVFRSYPVANNHVLFSAITWCWVRVLHCTDTEWLLRLPSVFFGVLTLLWVAFGWRRHLGARSAGLATILFAASPVFAPFAYQLRGYALSMFLGTVGVTAAADLSQGAARRGLALYLPTAVLLPLTIPPNVLLVVAHLLFLIWSAWGRPDWRDRAKCIAAVGAALALGCFYYLLILPQFLEAARHTAGWPNPALAAGSVGLAVIAHLGVAIAGRVHVRARSLAPFPGEGHPGAPPPKPVRGGRLLLSCVLLIGLTLAVLRPVPFPRVFLVFLPSLTFGLLTGLGRRHLWTRLRVLSLAGLLALSGYAWERGSAALTARQSRAGRHPQNLLQQYYRGDTGLSQAAHWFTSQGALQTWVVLTDAYDFPTFRYYWTLYGMDSTHVLQAGPSASRRWRADFAPAGCRLAILAQRRDQALQLAGVLRNGLRLRSVTVAPERRAFISE